ncbi:type II toxin-antitoxin system RelE/ParE family toxin [Abyssibacter profundi]|uniref:Plasmid stabilization protein ParE n=1 Tax=Abyssibacter profundi TaxID=2182787 RepID=A0A363UNF4_9GAMM|nr:type II toxin-antitoxin system RelE/ParE family toxin [Abyssibacter profundi]MBV61427.1 plasmid stabilization protein ParE [Nevskiales bacterium]PWN56958.1 plasmid stabilization protein ParE [Abyssibacter profundi]
MKPRYQLTLEAEQDLRGVFRYTLREWGSAQLERYRQALTETLNAIADGEVPRRVVSDNLPGVYVARCQHHFIFYVVPERKPPLVLAVLHERQDLVARLVERFEGY